MRGPGAPTTTLAERIESTPESCFKTNTASSSAPPRMVRTVDVTNSALPNQSIAVDIRCGCKSSNCPPPSAALIFSRQEALLSSGRKRSKRESIR